jgi:hypothetical protein
VSMRSFARDLHRAVARTTPAFQPVPAETAAWPEGVVVRYLTVGGATVDLGPFDEDDGAMPVECTGCGQNRWGTADPAEVAKSTYLPELAPSREDWDRQYAEQLARLDAKGWAQAHAATCRAMPRPVGGRS